MKITYNWNAPWKQQRLRKKVNFKTEINVEAERMDKYYNSERMYILTQMPPLSYSFSTQSG